MEVDGALEGLEAVDHASYNPKPTTNNALGQVDWLPKDGSMRISS